MQRRTFLVGGLGGVALLGCRPWLHPRAEREAPTEHQRQTLAAMADTFLPGGDGTPGAGDVDALSAIIDPSFGVNPYISEVVSDLDDWCGIAHGGRDFIDLDPAEREVALEERMGLRGGLIESFYKPVYEGINAMVKIAFFGGLTEVAGLNYLAFPGASAAWAGGSAGGAYASASAPVAIAPGAAQSIDVTGDGKVALVRVTVVASGDAIAAAKVIAPGGASHAFHLPVDDLAVPLDGGPAAGTWRLEIVDRGHGGGTLECWSLRLRTDLDEAVS